MNKKKALQYICENDISGIKAGLERETFLDIWMVVVNGRIFARSWGFAENSWYNSFLKDSCGQIKCGDIILNINAHIPDDLVDITPSINQVYLTKYSTKQYAKPITEGKHVEKTMEFIVCE
ncbi:DUF2255 family protein [Chryseobacterium sp. ISL-6]|uniref:DUF2255 family protein n=1 Tax=Chryseobacterium sp. ISL-6 TaxID=2819143 RepID=UPI001BE9AE23|nr:DUF2255 family protein [Chryseobacterium sp. ISL-6]MBT2619623.1 DUF2255 family protein [Chryseobacterium sp. ISL-6]